MTILSQVLEPMLVKRYRIINKILFLGLVPQPWIIIGIMKIGIMKIIRIMKIGIMKIMIIKEID